MITDRVRRFLDIAVALSATYMREGEGGPFGCIIVKDDEIIGRGNNKVTGRNDPTAHAEIVAIREACQALGSYQLTGCEVYSSCEPCPMCLGAIYWARPDRVYFANTREDAGLIEFDDAMIYREINTKPADRRIPFIHVDHAGAREVFRQWMAWEGRKKY